MNSLRWLPAKQKIPLQILLSHLLAKETDGGRRTSVFSKDRCSGEVLFRSDEFASVAACEAEDTPSNTSQPLAGKGNRWWPEDLRVQQGSMQRRSPLQLSVATSRTLPHRNPVSWALIDNLTSRQNLPDERTVATQPFLDFLRGQD